MLSKKIISDRSSKKWHLLVILYLASIIVYISYFAVAHKIFMLGFLIATVFMIFYEARIFIKDKIYLQINKDKGESL